MIMCDLDHKNPENYPSDHTYFSLSHFHKPNLVGLIEHQEILMTSGMEFQVGLCFI